jgi:hypothetical protein
MVVVVVVTIQLGTSAKRKAIGSGELSPRQPRDNNEERMVVKFADG